MAAHDRTRLIGRLPLVAPLGRNKRARGCAAPPRLRFGPTYRSLCLPGSNVAGSEVASAPCSALTPVPSLPCGERDRCDGTPWQALALRASAVRVCGLSTAPGFHPHPCPLAPLRGARDRFDATPWQALALRASAVRVCGLSTAPRFHPHPCPLSHRGRGAPFVWGGKLSVGEGLRPYAGPVREKFFV